jgi:kelch-like protein 10
MSVVMKVCQMSQSGLAQSSSSTKVKHSKENPTFKQRRCVCIPTDYGLIEFPRVWNELRLHQQLCDGVLHSSDGKTLYIHRVILCAVSPHFKTLFTYSLKGSKIERSEVSVDIPGHILELMLDYAYTGHCNVTLQNVGQLLPIADQYELLGVVQQCCQYLFEELQPENCLGILKFARHYFCHDLEERGRKYVCHNFKKILQQSSEFKDMSAEELESVLCDDELNVRNEELVFEAVIKWTEVDLQARKQYFKTLIHCVRYGLMSFEFFIDVVMNNKLILASPVCFHWTEI